MKRLEDELLSNKNRQAEMHDHENQRFYRYEAIFSLQFDSIRFDSIRREMKKNDMPPSPEPSIFMDDMVVISAETSENQHEDTMYVAPQAPLQRGKLFNSQRSIRLTSSRFFDSMIRKINKETERDFNGRTFRASTSCVLRFGSK